MAGIFGIGVGPGDPDLITLKGLRLLRAAAVIAYPAPETGSSLARSLAAPHLPGGQHELPIRMPMSLDRFPAQAAYDQADAEISAHVAAGRDVAVLCEGDPFFYGSFLYLFARLADRHPVTVVPGVSSLTACAAVAGLPLVARNDVLTVIPAPLPEEWMLARLQDVDAAVIVKVGRHIDKCRRVLAAAGLAEQAILVERATQADQCVRRLTEGAADEPVPYFATLLVHRRGAAWTL